VIAYFRSSSRKVAAGESHSCALQPAGNVVCWGLNTNGQLGTGDTSSMGSVTGITNAVAIAAGGYHTCALIGGGTVQCWGRNNHGQVGVIFGDDVGTPTNVPGITEAVAVTAGGWHTCAVKAGGTAFCWGHNANGQLGDGTTNDRFGPVGVDLSAVGPLTHQIAAGGFHTCAIVAADSTVACWGMNNDGQLGYPYSTPSDPIEATPGARVQKEDPGCGGDPTVGCAPIAKPTLLTAQTIAASIGVGQIGIPTYGGFHTVAIDTIGQDWSWGNNNDGQLTSPSGARKQAVQGTFSGVTKIAAGAYHTCIVKSIAGVFCRGNNDHQQSGPAAGVPSTLGSLDVAAGGYHTCAVIGTTFGFSSDPAGSVACWGEDNNGQVTGVPGGGNVTTPAFLTLP
jgi:alpha-tubulin suppressor-like RCC1 family protein